MKIYDILVVNIKGGNLMKKSNLIIFILVVIVIIAIFGFAIWQGRNSLENEGALGGEQSNTENTEQQNDNTNIVNNQNTNVSANETTNNATTNEITTNNNTNGNNTTNLRNYVGHWYISEEAYYNAERIDEMLDRREDNLITDEEFEREMSDASNTSIAELDVDDYFQNRIKFDFELTSPAPTQREGKIEDITVELVDNIGTFTYTDNWGTSGNGTITLKDNQIELRLETTSAAQGALWGVEGIYTFSYKRAD